MHKVHEEVLSKLIGAIYDTVLDETKWSETLVAIGDFTAAARVTLILEDARQPERSALFTSYDDPEWVRSYIEQYLLINPVRLAMEPFVRPGDVLLTTDFTTSDDYRKSLIAREFLAKRDLVDMASAVLERSGATITVLSLKRDRSQGFADEELRRKTRLIAPHVRRAAALTRALERQALRLQAFSESFDKLEAALMLLDGEGRIVERNRSASRALASGDAVADVDGKLVLRDPARRAEWQRALAASAAGKPIADDVESRALTGAAGRYAAALLPLDEARALKAKAPRGAVAMFCLRPIELAPPHGASAIAEAYGLTRQESAVMLAIAEVGGVRESAAALGLAEDTIRSHLKAVFRKTNTGRQADLVRLLANATLPVR